MLATITVASSSDYDIVKSMESYRQEQLKNISIAHQQNSAIVEQNRLYYTKISQAATAYYRDFVSKKWGDENVKLSNVTTFTQYSDNLNERQSVDFKNGIVSIEVISDEKSVVKPQYFEKSIKKLTKESLSEATKKDPVAALENRYLEKKSITTATKTKDKSKFLEGYIKPVKITKKDIKRKSVTLNSGEKKLITYVDVKMVPDHLEKRALKYKPMVLKKAKEYGVEPSTILATIQTESYFNPLAKSHVPAYGLMQIVPTTAGVDAYYALTKKKKLLSPDYLYDADNNIELGSKYIQIVRDNYLRGIKDERSKFYCAATSYNAGIGSLIYSFTGSKKKRTEAIKMINNMSPQAVYKHLRTSKRLTHEARNYVKSIKSRSENYKAWDKEV